MRNGRRGFTLIEVLISLAILALVMSAVSTFFLGSIRTFKVQSRIVQSGMDTLVGMELLRKDVRNAGFGLPWNNIPAYSDAASGILSDSNVAPRGIVSMDNWGLNGSDYLVIKAANVGSSVAGGKWTTLQTGNAKRNWTSFAADNSLNLQTNDRVIVLSPGSSGTNWRSLETDGSGNWTTTYGNTGGFAPTSAENTRILYGIDGPGGSTLRMPFSRADYFISTANVPQRCAPNTGVLVKEVVSQADGSLGNPLPLLDCVADMQVQFDLDTDGDGVIDNTAVNDISSYNATEIRSYVKRVRINVLAHEGSLDDSYQHPFNPIAVGNTSVNLDNAAFLNKGRNYRWKVYTLSVSPENLND